MGSRDWDNLIKGVEGRQWVNRLEDEIKNTAALTQDEELNLEAYFAILLLHTRLKIAMRTAFEAGRAYERFKRLRELVEER